MSLAAKLARLSPITSTERAPARPGGSDPSHASSSARRIERRLCDDPFVDVPHREQAALPGRTETTPVGEVHVVDRYFEPHATHGRVPLARALDVHAETIAALALDETLASVDMRRLVFLDTETTGLAGGTGTIPFLVGMAWFEDESLRVEQLFLKELAREAPMLARVRERIAQASAIVTYNGKSFDWPLLRSRFVLSRLAIGNVPPHIDLLHCARRVYRRRLAELRLVELERELFRFEREDDIPGAEVPDAYLAFLRRGDPRRVCQVIEHNTNDIIALVALLSYLAERYATIVREDDPRDHLSLAHVAFRAEDLPRAHDFAAAAVDGGADPDVTISALSLRAHVARRTGDVGSACGALERALAVANESAQDPATLHLALAKLYEHRRADPETALSHARLAVGAERDEDASRRVDRLEAKLARRTRTR